MVSLRGCIHHVDKKLHNFTGSNVDLNDLDKSTKLDETSDYSRYAQIYEGEEKEKCNYISTSTPYCR